MNERRAKAVERYHRCLDARASRYARRSTYAVELVGLGIVKIGMSTSVHDRIKAFRRYAPYGLKLIGIIPGDCESEMHRRFRRLRIKGEWFRSSPTLLKAFR